jgi:hypothetical protein
MATLRWRVVDETPEEPSPLSRYVHLRAVDPELAESRERN